MARNEELHGPRSDTTRMYLSRKKGGRGLITDVKLALCPWGRHWEENNVRWYVRNSEEVLLRIVGKKRNSESG